MVGRRPALRSRPGSGFAPGSSCGSTIYSGPDSGAATATGGQCVDQAGNASVVPGAFTLKYDTTPPALTATAAAGGGSILVQWEASSDAVAVDVTRTHSKSDGTPSVIYKSLLGNQVIDQGVLADALYTYRVTATDQAGNSVVRTVSVQTNAPPAPGAPPIATIIKSLITPADGKVLRAPTPKLRWPAVANATYYNVQVFVKGRKVLTAWPKKNSLQLAAKWKLNGKKYTLPRGVKVTWYVWPATGTIATPKFGKLIGKSSFSIKK